MPPAGPLPSSDNRALRWIGALQLCKGLLLIAIALGFLSFLHKDVDLLVGAWMTHVGINVENSHVAALLEALDLVTDKQLFQLSIGAFCFAGVLITQGTGLLLRRQWAKYLTLIATSALVPFEAFELCKGFGYIKLSVLLVNLVIVAFMISFLRRGRSVTPRRIAVIPPSVPARAVFAVERGPS